VSIGHRNATGATDVPVALFSFNNQLRWQLERCFKAWKSYANLHEFGTANAHMAEGLM